MDELTEKPQLSWKEKASFTVSKYFGVGFAFALWEKVLENPFTAGLLLICYWIIENFGQKIYLKIWKAEEITDKGLEGKFINACVDWLENKLPEQVSNLRRSINFKKAYEKAIYYEHRFFNVKGLRIQGNFILELDKIFVELKISPTVNYQQGRLNLLGIKELEGSKPIWDFLNIAQQQQPEFAPAFAIIGAPGSGKTTLLQYIALNLIKDKKLLKSKNYLPIFLFLREHTKSILEKESPNLSQLVQIHFSQHKCYQNLQPPTNYFEEQLKAGKCLIMLDGLDEVANENQRKKVSSWVNEQINLYRQCPVILTSRPQGYKAAPLEKVNLLEIQPFNYQQIKKFIHNWYLANEIMSTAKEDEGVKRNAQLNAEDLLERLQSLPSLSALTVNPLLLTMIAMVHRYRGQLPGRRVELYAEICDVLLGHWWAAKQIKERKGAEESLTAAQKRVILQPLAAEMMLRGKRQISNQEALEIIAEPLKTVNLNKTETINFLPNVQASSGLLQESEIGEWQFAHLSFQEYLAATHFIENKHLLDFNSIIENTWWHETLRLYAAQTDTTDLIKNCLTKQSISALSLAADCLEEARQIQTEVREEVEKKLISDLESDDPEIRKFAAEIQLHRRLTKCMHWYRLDEHREISDFITCAEYQLFLDEMEKQNKFHQPDHWDKCCYPKGTSLKPITGIRGEDANVFCKWLNNRDLNILRKDNYCLPNYYKEIYNNKEVYSNTTTLQKDNVPVGYWCLESEQYNLIWENKDDKILYSKIMSMFCEKSKKNIPFYLEQKHIYNLYTFISNEFSKIFCNYITNIYTFDIELNELSRIIAGSLQRNYQHDFTCLHIKEFKKISVKSGKKCLEGLPYGLYKELTEDEEYCQKKDNNINCRIAEKISEYTEKSLIDTLVNLINLNTDIEHDIENYIIKKIPRNKIDKDNPTRSYTEIYIEKMAAYSYLITNSGFYDAFYNMFNPNYMGNMNELSLRLKNAWKKLLFSLLSYLVGFKEIGLISEDGIKATGLEHVINNMVLLNKKNSNREDREKNFIRYEFPLDNYELKKELLSLFWWLYILQKRKNNILPAWEGLRIVREKKFD